MTSTGEENTVITFDRGFSKWHKLEPKSKKWKDVPIEHIPGQGRDFTSLVLDEYLYTIFEPGSMFRLKYGEPQTGWAELSDTIVDHGWYNTCTTFNGSIFLVGSSDFNEAFYERTVERYIVHLDKWVKIQNLKIRRVHCGVVAAAGYVYAFGGLNEHMEAMKSSERYDMRTNRWGLIADMPRRASFTSALTKRDHVYVVDDQGIMDYNTTSNSWSTITFKKKWPFESKWFNRLLDFENQIICIGKLRDCYAVYLLDVEEGTFKLCNKMDGKDIWAIQTVSVKL